MLTPTQLCTALSKNLLSVGLVFGSILLLNAQSNTPATAQAPAPQLQPAKVLGVTCNRKVQDLSTSSSGCIIGLDDTVRVKVQNLPTLITESEKAKKPIVLFLDNIPVNGISPIAINAHTNEITFLLARTEPSRKAWASLLGLPRAQKLTMRYWGRNQLPISVGLQDGLPIPSDETVGLIIVRKWHMWAWLAGVAVFLVLFWFADRKGNLLRDAGPNPVPPLRKPRSLAKCQMAFWFILVVFSFTFIWIVTGDLDTISESILVMIGIGTGTALGVALQNTRKEQASTLVRELQQLQTDIAAKRKDLKASLAAAPASANVQPIIQDLKNLEAELNEKIPHSKGLFDDLLTDCEGYTLHRLQMVIWTAVLGIIFVYKVWGNLAMPDFSATLLALMGISSGTYLGFMTQEKHSSEEMRK